MLLEIVRVVDLSFLRIEYYRTLYLPQCNVEHYPTCRRGCVRPLRGRGRGRGRGAAAWHGHLRHDGLAGHHAAARHRGARAAAAAPSRHHRSARGTSLNQVIPNILTLPPLFRRRVGHPGPAAPASCAAQEWLPSSSSSTSTSVKTAQ